MMSTSIKMCIASSTLLLCYTTGKSHQCVNARVDSVTDLAKVSRVLNAFLQVATTKSASAENQDTTTGGKLHFNYTIYTPRSPE